MTPAEQAEVYRNAAQVVAGMDTLQAEIRAHEQTSTNGGTWMSCSYGPGEVAANRAYSCAAAVLTAIADAFDRAALKGEPQ